jgi:hypothetical protein
MQIVFAAGRGCHVQASRLVETGARWRRKVVTHPLTMGERLGLEGPRRLIPCRRRRCADLPARLSGCWPCEACEDAVLRSQIDGAGLLP